jgi:hypothetical protein
LPFSKETIAKLFAQTFRGQSWLSQYILASNSDNIHRNEKGLAAIQKARHDETTEEQFHGDVRLVNNVEANRLRSFPLRFPRTRSTEKSSATGFTGPRWPELATAPEQPRYLLRQIDPHQPPVTFQPPVRTGTEGDKNSEHCIY